MRLAIVLMVALFNMSFTTQALNAQNSSFNPRCIRPIVKDTDESVSSSTFLPSFLAEERLLQQMNAVGKYRKVASIRFDAAAADGLYSLQIGTGQPLYIGSDLRKLTQQLNRYSNLAPGDTLYVNVDAPQNRLEGLNRSLRLQQGQINGEVEVVPLGGDALNMETRDLIFNNPVVAIRGSEVFNSASHAGWFEKTVDFSVKVGNAIKTVHLAIIARSAEILNNIWLALSPAAVQHQGGVESRSISEIVSRARYDVKRRNGHIDRVDYLFSAEIGQSFMVSLPIRTADNA
jgi:hypothetical protein